MMKKLYIALLILISTSILAQNPSVKNDKKFDFRFGSGWSLLGTGDYNCITFENELNYRLSRYFTTSASIGLGHSFAEASSSGFSAYFEGNLNIFISPFRNNRINDFRIGGGLSVYNVYDNYLQSVHYVDGIHYKDYYTRKETALGWTLIFEDTFAVNDKLLIGAKAFIQPFFNGDINSGFTAKVGIRF